MLLQEYAHQMAMQSMYHALAITQQQLLEQTNFVNRINLPDEQDIS